MDIYLNQCKTHLLKLSQFENIELVVGNDSCDLDSTVAANVTAFLKHTDYENEESNKYIVIPVLNIARNELKLRTEVSFWFEEVLELSLDLLICKDEIDFTILKNKNVLLTLVDHNINKEFSSIGKIIEIIDHHKPSFDTNNCPVSDPSKVTIDVEVGSCCTLVAERFLTSPVKDDTQLALMLYGTILLDTICFSKSAQRFSDRDLSVVERLESAQEIDSSTRQEIYQQLIKAKNSISNLNIEELLRKDMKLIENTGNLKIIVSSISGILVSDLNLDDKRGLLQQFSSNNKYDAIVVLGIENNITESIKRDLAVFTRNRTLMQSISSQLESKTSELELKLLIETNDLRIYGQGNIKASRKVILPLISSVNNIPNSENQSKQNANEKEDRELNLENNITPVHRKKLLTTQISTADVDPDFVINYIPETVEFLESPKYSAVEPEIQRQLSFPSSPIKETSNGSPNVKTSENNKETELEISTYDMSKPNNPESVYGSYIEDSFVGELVGDYVNDENAKDVNDLDNNWALNNVINNEIEFEFDSFGPESIIYTGNNDNLDDKLVSKLTPVVNEETAQNTNNVNESNTTESQPEKTNTDIVDEQKRTENETKVATQPSLEISSPDTNPNLTSDSDMSQITLEENDVVTPFKRNTSLTQSQRKKISPRINLQQILNSSDDMTPTISSGSDPILHPLSTVNIKLNDDNNKEIKDENATDNANTLLSNKLDLDEELNNRGLVRRPSTTKKKINVNREFFTNDELIDKHEPEANPIEQLTAREELDEMRAWRQSCPIGPEGEVKPIDMKVIDPYKKVISHGGYFHCNASVDNSNHSGSSPAIIVFSACYLPDRSRKDYNYVMDNLFMYVLTTLHNLIADDYILIYFHNAGGGALGNNMPTFSWLKRCYYMIDRKLKKNLKGLYLVHPTFWLKTLIIMSKPFISSKFSRKLKFVNSLSELSDLLPIEHIAIPEPVKKIDFDLMIKHKKRQRSK